MAFIVDSARRGHDGAVVVSASVAAGLICLVLAGASPAAQAQQGEQIRFDRLTHEDGLPQDSVNSVVQDHAGFMWFGSVDGLSRYSGYGFDVYRANPDDPASLADDVIGLICEDSAHALWIGTDRGLHRLDPDRRSFRRFALPETPGFSSRRSRPYAVLEERPGRLLVGLAEGLFVVEDQRAGLVPWSGSSSQTLAGVRAIARGPGDVIWIGTSNGLYRLEGAVAKPWTEGLRVAPSAARESIREVQALLPTPDGTLFVGTTRGFLKLWPAGRDEWQIRRFQHRDGVPTSLPDDRVTKMALDPGGILWIATGNGLASLSVADQLANRDRFTCYHFDPQNPNSLANDSTNDIAVDRTGIVWVATYGGGVSKIVRRAESFKRYTKHTHGAQFNGQSVMTIHEDRHGAIWLGTESALHRFDPPTDRLQPFVIPPALRRFGVVLFKAVLEDRSGALWVGTSQGLYEFERSAGRFRPAGGAEAIYVRALHQDRGGTIWLGTNRGLRVLDRGRDLLTRVGGEVDRVLGQLYVYTISEDSGGRLLVGTVGAGLFEFDRDAQGMLRRFRAFRHDPGDAKSLSGDDVLSVLRARDGTLWVGTTGGLSRLGADGQGFVNFNEAQGLANRTVYSILEDQFGRLWMSTNNGVSCFTPETRTFRNYFYADGLQNNEFNGGAHCRCRNGLLIFGGIRGFSTILPSGEPEIQLSPGVALTEMRVNGIPRVLRGGTPASDAPAARSLRLSYEENSVSFAFAVLDFADPRKKQFRYRMEGLDPDSTHSGNRSFASYSHLGPGRYTFRVMGANGSGTWGRGAAAVSFEIVPPVWKRLWFRGFALVAGLAVVLAAHRMRTLALRRRLKKEHIEQKLRLKADLTAMIVHDLRTPLTCIKGYCEMMTPSLPEPQAEYLGTVQRASDRMLDLINDMLDLSKLEAGKVEIRKRSERLDLLVETTLKQLMPLTQEKQIDLEVVGTESGTIELDPDRIGQVLMNLVGNAIKFSPPGGRIEVACRHAQEGSRAFCEIQVSDEGPGIDEKYRPLLFNPYAQFEQPGGRKVHKGSGLGLAVSRLIVELHGGEIGYRPVPTGGSAFYFRLPETPGSVRPADL